MPKQPDDALARLESEEIAQVALDILLERHPALVAFEELTAEFPHAESEEAIPDSVIDEGVDELVRLDLAHRLDKFVFASYTAVRAKQLG